MTKRRKYRRKQKNAVASWIITLIIIIWGGWFELNPASQNSNQSQEPSSSQQVVDNATTVSTNYGGLSNEDYQRLASLDFESGDRAYVYVDNNKSTLIKNAWKVNKVVYSNLDNLNRTSHPNTAFLEPRNVADDSLRVKQFINLTAWRSNRENGTQIYNRGRLTACSISVGIDQDGNYDPNNQSSDQNNPKNLFTQAVFSNQKVQTIFEGGVRNALKQGSKIISQVTSIFGGNGLMARSINSQAISLNNSLNFNVYLFNVQSDYVFDYNNGKARIDRNMIINQ